jgi:oxaloacetate decarboxylase gamma subunit
LEKVFRHLYGGVLPKETNVGGLLESGIELMMIGMGTVFSFLTLLVFATRAMSWAVLKLGFATTPSQTNIGHGQAAGAGGQGANTQQHVAAIAVALDTHLSTKNK